MIVVSLFDKGVLPFQPVHGSFYSIHLHATLNIPLSLLLTIFHPIHPFLCHHVHVNNTISELTHGTKHTRVFHTF